MSDRRPSSPLALSDEQLDQIFRLTKPLQPVPFRHFRFGETGHWADIAE
jgi:hypothetical protein